MERRTHPLSHGVGAGFWAVAYLFLGGFVAPLILLLHDVVASAYVPLVWVAGGMFISLIMYDWKRTGQILTVGGILAFGGLLLFFLRGITVQVDGTTTAGAAAQTQYFVGENVTAGALAMTQVILFYLMIGCAYFAKTLHYHPKRVTSTRDPASNRSIRRARLLLIATTILAFLLTLDLVSGAGGIHAYISGLSLRSSFFAGHNYLTYGYIPLSVALVLYVVTIRTRPERRVLTPLPIVSAVVLLVNALATGGRGPLILGAFLPLLLLKQIGNKPFRSAGLGFLTIFVIIVALTISLTLRSNAYDKGASDRALRSDPVNTLLDTLTSGQQTRPLDSLILLNSENAQGQLPFQLGITYLKPVTWFIPGALDPDKDNGANAWFTAKYLPGFYYPVKLETSLSAIGEAFANFGWPGVAIVGLLLGLAAGAFAKRQRQSLYDDLLFVLVTPLFFVFVRSDAYESLPVAALTIVLARIFFNVTFVGTPTQLAGQPSGHHSVSVNPVT